MHRHRALPVVKDLRESRPNFFSKVERKSGFSHLPPEVWHSAVNAGPPAALSYAGLPEIPWAWDALWQGPRCRLASRHLRIHQSAQPLQQVGSPAIQ